MTQPRENEGNSALGWGRIVSLSQTQPGGKQSSGPIPKWRAQGAKLFRDVPITPPVIICGVLDTNLLDQTFPCGRTRLLGGRVEESNDLTLTFCNCSSMFPAPVRRLSYLPQDEGLSTVADTCAVDGMIFSRGGWNPWLNLHTNKYSTYGCDYPHSNTVLRRLSALLVDSL